MKFILAWLIVFDYWRGLVSILLVAVIKVFNLPMTNEDWDGFWEHLGESLTILTLLLTIHALTKLLRKILVYGYARWTRDRTRDWLSARGRILLIPQEIRFQRIKSSGLARIIVR